MAVGLMLGLSACNTQNAITEHRQAPYMPELTLAQVMPVTQPASPEAKVSQAKFLEEDMTRFRSRELASAYYVLQAQRASAEEKLDSATYFFSRAYLMDSTNNDIFRGYGLLYGKQQKYDEALFVLYHALEKDQDNPLLLNDIATSHLSRFYVTSNPEDLLQSRKLLEKAVQLSPTEADLYYKLAINSYYLQEYENAWTYLHKSLRRNRDIADQAFISALLEKQRDPQGTFTPELRQ